MPLTVDPDFRTHLNGELTTLCTLWEIKRRDNVYFRYTDHDQDITYGGNAYSSGIGYNRSAVADKGDMSVDNMDVQGILTADDITRADIRSGLFDSALVTLTVINYADPTMTGVIRRRGWFGNVKQNSNGEFSVELRGLTQALSETMTNVYTPGCRVDLGAPRCRVPLDLAPALRISDHYYPSGIWVRASGVANRVFVCIKPGRTAASYNPTLWTVGPNVTFLDGDARFAARFPFEWGFRVEQVTDRKTFYLSVKANPLGTDPTYFDGGTITFTSGDNAGITYEVKKFDVDTGNDGEVNLFLRTNVPVVVGDLGLIYPGCTKGKSTCLNRFKNVVNFQGFPNLPGDKYIKDYPDAKG